MKLLFPLTFVFALETGLDSYLGNLDWFSRARAFKILVCCSFEDITLVNEATFVSYIYRHKCSLIVNCHTFKPYSLLPSAVVDAVHAESVLAVPGWRLHRGVNVGKGRSELSDKEGERHEIPSSFFNQRSYIEKQPGRNKEKGRMYMFELCPNFVILTKKNQHPPESSLNKLNNVIYT